MITQFRVQNYKALRDVSLDLTPVHVLIGPNNSGKTSILEAIQALCRTVDHPLEQAFVGSWKGRELVWNGDRAGVVTLAASIREDRVQFEYQLKSIFPTEVGRSVLNFGETIKSDSTVNLSHNGTTTSFIYDSYLRSFVTHSSIDTVAMKVHQALSFAQMYRLDPRMLALPAAPDSSRRFRMDPSGFGLALFLDDILGYDRDRFIALEKRFQRIFPSIKSIKLVPEPAFRAPQDHTRYTPLLQPSDGKGIYFQVENNPSLVPASQASDGVLLVLAYLTILSIPQPPRVILIEEPENGIHPKRLREVLTILRDLVKERPASQIILTTHSPYALDMFEPEEVTICRQRDGETVVARLSDSKTVRDQLDIFSLGEIWTAEGDDKIAAPAVATGVQAP